MRPGRGGPFPRLPVGLQQHQEQGAEARHRPACLRHVLPVPRGTRASSPSLLPSLGPSLVSSLFPLPLSLLRPTSFLIRSLAPSLPSSLRFSLQGCVVAWVCLNQIAASDLDVTFPDADFYFGKGWFGMTVSSAIAFFAFCGTAHASRKERAAERAALRKNSLAAGEEDGAYSYDEGEEEYKMDGMQAVVTNPKASVYLRGVNCKASWQEKYPGTHTYINWEIAMEGGKERRREVGKEGGRNKVHGACLKFSKEGAADIVEEARSKIFRISFIYTVPILSV
ncbi:hypothetical protein Naga_101609g2 [Nannochloropsis gaditana]|uniref:Uncharacterized protein n=1 Tax=Nannochloropsis gaditana TaxID=72520 RepID=W7TL34_9STRA|nr:hypothetical protein Naga_101609g2 [Nannochloropsis gaditana]